MWCVFDILVFRRIAEHVSLSSRAQSTSFSTANEQPFENRFFELRPRGNLSTNITLLRCGPRAAKRFRKSENKSTIVNTKRGKVSDWGKKKSICPISHYVVTGRTGVEDG